MRKMILSWVDEDNHPISRMVNLDELSSSNIQIIDEDITIKPGTSIKLYSMDELDQASALLIDNGIRGEIGENKTITLLDKRSNETNNTRDLVQKQIPGANKYLEEYNQQLANDFLTEGLEVTLSSNLGGITHSKKVKILSSDPLEITIPTSSVIKTHLHYSNIIEIYDHKRDHHLECFVEEIKEYSEDLSRVRLKPIQFHYGDSTTLETYDFKDKPSVVTQAQSKLKKSFNYWFNVLRAKQYFITLFSIIFTISYFWGEFDMREDIFNLSLVIIGTFSIQAGGNLLNDYFDHQSKLDDINIFSLSKERNSGYIQNKMIHPSTNISIGMLLFILGAGIGLYLNYIAHGNLILLLGILGAVITYFYTAEPIKLAYRGLGEIFLALNFGPLIIIGTALVLNENNFIKFPELYLTIPSLLFITGLLILNEIDDIEADRLLEKKTTALRLGRNNSIIFSFLLVVVSFILPSIVFSNTDWLKAMGFLIGAILLNYVSVKNAWRNSYESPKLEVYSLIYPLWILYSLTF